MASSRSRWCLMSVALLLLIGLAHTLPAENTMSSSSSVSASFSSSSIQQSASASVSSPEKKQLVKSTTTTTEAPAEAEAPVVVPLDEKETLPEYQEPEPAPEPAAEPKPEPEPEPEPKPAEPPATDESDLQNLKPDIVLTPAEQPIDEPSQKGTVEEEVNDNSLQQQASQESGSATMAISVLAIITSALMARIVA